MKQHNVAIPSIGEVIDLARDYMERKGLRQKDFASRIGYSVQALRFFLAGPGKYAAVNGDEQGLAAAIMKLIGAADDDGSALDGPLFETHNYKLIKQHFSEALDAGCACYFRGAPGSQKTFVLRYLSSELNRAEASKNGHGRRAFYVRCRYGITPRELMTRVAITVGILAAGSTERILQNLKFHLRSRHCLIIFDEAQGLSFACLEIVRELLDELPLCGILFAGSHELEQRFMQLNMQQWHSRIRKGTALPGVQEAEAQSIIRTLLGDVSAKAATTLISGSYDKDIYGGKLVKYISMRKLAGALALIKSRQQQAKAVSA
jgi:DNA transposition AAA+ family ATPase